MLTTTRWWILSSSRTLCPWRLQNQNSQKTFGADESNLHTHHLNPPKHLLRITCHVNPVGSPVKGVMKSLEPAFSAALRRLPGGCFAKMPRSQAGDWMPAAHAESGGMRGIPLERIWNNMQGLNFCPYTWKWSWNKTCTKKNAEKSGNSTAGSSKISWCSGHDGDPTTDVVDEHVYLLPSVAET